MFDDRDLDTGPPVDDPGGDVSDGWYTPPPVTRWRWPDLFWWLR